MRFDPMTREWVLDNGKRVSDQEVKAAGIPKNREGSMGEIVKEKKPITKTEREKAVKRLMDVWRKWSKGKITEKGLRDIAEKTIRMAVDLATLGPGTGEIY